MKQNKEVHSSGSHTEPHLPPLSLQISIFSFTCWKRF